MRNRIEQISHSMDLDEQLPLHRTGWRWQPLGKALILGLMLAGLLGLFGEGLFSKQLVRQGTAAVQFQRMFRMESEMKLEVVMTGVGGRSAVSFPLSYIKNMKVHKVVPEPESSFIRGGQVWYVFEADQNLQADFYLEPLALGNIHGSVWVNDQYLLLSHFIFP